MGSFLMCIAQYLIIMAAIAAVGFGGAKVGINLRKVKNARNAASAENEDE